MSPAGYSGTPLLQKLGIKEGHRIAILHAPRPMPADLRSIPSSVAMSRDLRRNSLDVIVQFVTGQASLRKEFAAAAARLNPDGGLWVAWPKKSSGVATDLTEDGVREVALAALSRTPRTFSGSARGAA
ncbi:MAG: DUF3052 domain-containing protein [Acidobacteria bacterium]|nr:DUF3052 domain-containing protein [Acidobacteriota bacterium]